LQISSRLSGVVIPSDLRRDSEGRDDTSGNEGQPVLQACAVEALSLRRITWGLLVRGTCGLRLSCRFRCALYCRPLQFGEEVPFLVFGKTSATQRIILRPRSSPSPEGQPLKIALRQWRDSEIFHHEFAREPAGILMLTMQTPLPSIGSATAPNRCYE